MNEPIGTDNVHIAYNNANIYTDLYNNLSTNLFKHNSMQIYNQTCTHHLKINNTNTPRIIYKHNKAIQNYIQTEQTYPKLYTNIANLYTNVTNLSKIIYKPNKPIQNYIQTLQTYIQT